MRELFLVSSGGIRYGIRKDEILSVRSLDALHRIPLSPARIAGIMIDDGQTVTLADLSASIGHEPATAIEQGCILLMEEGEKVTGFVVSGAIDTQPVSPELFFPLPDLLKTPVFDSCAINGGIPVPIINIAELYSRVMKSGEQLSFGPSTISAIRPRDVSGTPRIKFFSVGGERFALFAAAVGDKAAVPGSIIPLPFTPPYVKGVTFRDGCLLPVIDLSQRIKRQNGEPWPLMIFAGLADANIAVLADGDGGALSADEATIKQMPLIAQTPWLKNMVMLAGEPIPLIDLAAMALPGGSGMGDETPLWQRYTAGSNFPDLFAKQDIDVVEFSLLGERHALPRQEVEDVIAFKPCRELPDMPPIVIGVAEHHGEILPVLDLAMMFGRRSLATPAWRMMLVSNGDFRALLITETVFKERRLPLDIHRAVPLRLPHHFMYGCYPDAEAVRLILNVEAISVHFEKSLIQQFLPALSHRMRMMSTNVEAVHEVEPAEALRAEPEARAVQKQAGVLQDGDRTAPELQQHAAEATVESNQAQHSFTEASAMLLQSESADVEFVTASSAGARKSLSSSGEWSEWGTDEALEETPEETIAPESDMGEQSPGGEYVVAQQDDLTAASGVDRLSEPMRAVASSRFGAPYRLHQEERIIGAWKRRIAYGAVAAVLLAVLLYFTGTADKPAVVKVVKQTQPSREQPDMAQAGPQHPVEKPVTPSPVGMPPAPVDNGAYVVKEGDTLWDISKRFTGNPYNYPRIAGENRIDDSDLIYPGQNINLK